MRLISKFLIFVLLVSRLSAEDNPVFNILHVSFSPNKVILNRGDSSVVKAKLKLKSGYHIFIGKKNPDSQSIITSFTSDNPRFSVIQKKNPLGDAKSDPDNIILKKEGIFELEIFDVSTRKRRFSGSLNILVKTQICDEKKNCFEPITLNEKINLELRGEKNVAAKSFQGEISKIQWKTSYEEALRNAKQKKQNIYVLVTAPAWCSACRYLQETTFTDPRVYEMLNKSFVNLYVDFDFSPDVDKFTIEEVPSNFILDEKGKIIFSETGAYPPDGFISIIQPYAK